MARARGHARRREQINALFHETMGMSRPIDHDLWKIWDNPYGEPHVMLADDNGRVVGQYALWPLPVRLGGMTVLGAQSLDTMTHPEYQGQGMFTVLANACFELAASRGCEVLFGFPNANSYPGFVRRLNWDHTGDTPYFVRPLNLGALPRVNPVIGFLGGQLTRLLPSGNRHGIRFECAQPATEQLQELAEPLRAERDACSIDRDKTWFEWRFSDRAGRRYEWITARSGGAVVEAPVWGMDIISSYPKALLSDLYAKTPEVAQALVSEVVTRARASGAAILAVTCSRPALQPILRRCGFLGNRSMPPAVL